MEVVTIGETMAVFSPYQKGKLRYATHFNISFAGAESNVAIALSNLGVKVSWISKLGEDEFGRAIHSFIAGHSIDTGNVMFTGKAPTGIMIKEYRNAGTTNVYYYRKNSAFSLIDEKHLNAKTFEKAKVLHLTGITPLLSESAYVVCLLAIRIAKKNQMKIVFDPNIRMKLIENEDQLDRIRCIAMQCDYFLPNVDEARYLFDIKSNKPEEIVDRLRETLKATVVLKDGVRGTYFADAHNRGLLKTYQVEEADPIGAGDAFAAGFIFGLLSGAKLAQAVDTANAMGAQAIMVKGDIENLPSLTELEHFINQKSEEITVNR